MENKKLEEKPFSKTKQKVFDVVLGMGYVLVTILLIYFFHDENYTAIALSLFIGLSGLTIGWLIGILATPFSDEEQKKFSQLKTTIIGFLSGYFLSKIEPVLSKITSDIDAITQDLTVMRFLIFIVCGIFGFISMFVYRRYYLNRKEVGGYSNESS